MSEKHLNPNFRHDFVYLFDVFYGNANGNPDTNFPRVDPETMHGYTTDVCLKRRARDWVSLAMEGKEGYRIYMEQGSVLNLKHQSAYEELKLPPTKEITKAAKKKEAITEAESFMCKTFYDVRMFGAVMTTGNYNCGQIRGPVQLVFPYSISPVTPINVPITRVAITREDAQITKKGDLKETEMGDKSLIPYGLYQGYGFFSPSFARKTGVSSEDLKLFWDSLLMMWELDRSASRGLISCRGLYIFSHENPLGNAPANSLFDRISTVEKEGIIAPRHFKDYEVSVNDTLLPKGVTLIQLP